MTLMLLPSTLSRLPAQGILRISVSQSAGPLIGLIYCRTWFVGEEDEVDIT